MFESELVRFFVQHDVLLKDWIKPEKIDELNMLVASMYAEGELVLDYDRACRLIVRQKGERREEIDVDEFRKYFLKPYSGYSNYAGSKDQIRVLLKEYMVKHPGHNYELICRATKNYVDVYKHTEYLMKAHNFIINDRGISTLEAAVDDLIAEKTSDNTDSTLL